MSRYDWGDEVYAVTNAGGAAEAVADTENEAIQFAEDESDGGDVFVICADPGSELVPNAVDDAGWKAYEQTGLLDVCMEKYGQPYLTADLVDSLDLMKAWATIRPYLPPSDKYNPSWKNMPTQIPDSDTGSFGMLAANAKLAKDQTFDGSLARCFGLSLAPHRAGLRPMGIPTKGGFQYFASPTKPADAFVDTQQGKDYLFGVSSDDSDNPLAKQFGGRKGNDGALGVQVYAKTSTSERRPTVCPRATGGNFGCIASCLAHSGQNPASDEALQSKLALTAALYADPAAFCKLLLETLRRYFAAACAGDMALFVRLNVFSDIPWERLFPDLIDPRMKLAFREFDTASKPRSKWSSRKVISTGSFYDYTKVPRRIPKYVEEHLAPKYPQVPIEQLYEEAESAYWLTFSYSGTGDNRREAEEHLDEGGTVAVVFIREEGTWAEEAEDAEFVADGPPLQGISTKVSQVFARKYDVDGKTMTLVNGLWEYARSNEMKDGPTSGYGKAVKALGEAPPRTAGRAERFDHARRLISRLIGAEVAAKDLELRPTTAESKTLRGRYAGRFWYDFTFLGRPVLNADANDLRGMDRRLIADAAQGRAAHIAKLRQSGAIAPGETVPPGTVVGLDFKPPMIKTKLDYWEVVVPGKKTPLAAYLTQQQAEDLLKDKKIPKDARVKRMGLLTGKALDLTKSKFVTGVRETPSGLLIAAQTPRSTAGGDL